MKLINFFINYERNKNKNNWKKSLGSKENKEKIIETILTFSLQLSEGRFTKERKIIKQTFELLINLIDQDENELLKYLYSWEMLTNWINSILLESQSIPLRKQASMGIINFCNQIKLNKNQENTAPPTEYFLNLLLNFINQTENYSNRAEYYFLTLQSLLNDYLLLLKVNDAEFSKFNENLLLKLIELVKKHKVLEVNESAESTDKSLIGLFDLIRIIISISNPSIKLFASQHGLMNELFHNCLFAIPTAANHGL